MIQSVTVTNYLNESLTLTLADPYSTGLAITEMSGLGASKANISSTEIATSDGARFNSSRLTTRNVTLSIRFIPNPTIESINSVEKCRQKTYKFFPIKKKLVLTIKTDERETYVTGYVESNEQDIFKKETSCKISIICPDPWFYSTQKDVSSFGGINKEFFFPKYGAYNNIGYYTTKDEPKPVGIYAYDDVKNIYYTGDSSTGMLMTLHIIGPVNNIAIYNTETKEFIKINDSKLKKIEGLSNGIIALDDILISSIRGEKYMHLIRGGKTYNILNALDKNSTWLELGKGDNSFTYSVGNTEGSSPNNLQFYITTQVIYEGI